MNKTAILFATTLAAIPAGAHASITGFYGTVQAGGQSTSGVDTVIYAPQGAIFGGGNNDVVAAAAVAPAPAGSDKIEGRYKIDTAFQIGGALGYDFGLVRAEVNVNYSSAKVKSLNVTQLTGLGGQTTTDLNAVKSDVCFALDQAACSTSGNALALDGVKLKQVAVLGNAWIDVPLPGPFSPYVGGGLGAVHLDVDGEGKTVFAWQVGAGVAYSIIPHVAITADVRHRESGKVNMDFGGGYGANFGRVKSTTYGLGLRVSF
jgi:opacity protein-like surface antigen